MWVSQQAAMPQLCCLLPCDWWPTPTPCGGFFYLFCQSLIGTLQLTLDTNSLAGTIRAFNILPSHPWFKTNFSHKLPPHSTGRLVNISQHHRIRQSKGAPS